MASINEVKKVTEQTQVNIPAHISNFQRMIESQSINWLISNANSIHRNIGIQVRKTAVDIWRVGKILNREKEIVGHGEWQNHCARVHPEISLDAIERYMKVGQIVIDQLPTILDKTPRQAYLMLGIVKQKKSPTTDPERQEAENAKSAHVRNMDDTRTWTPITCPSCNSAIELTRKGKFWIVRASPRAAE